MCTNNQAKKDIGIHSVKTEENKTQRLMHTVSYKPVEKILQSKPFAGTKAHSDNLVDCLQLEHFW